ncbi:HXXEE domain-containing protein [Candidatus Gottesmanbacteria bacterium]|nr:HXXEE domain-containing protein [Candidatus Gottesmanbacteria bacterium]
MSPLEQFFTISLLVQIAHATEELSTGFHKKWYVIKVPLEVFLAFEVVFECFWIAVWLFQDFPSRAYLQTFFLALMFANGVQHIVWAGNVKKYVPGLVTAPVHCVVFLMFYFKFIY